MKVGIIIIFYNNAKDIEKDFFIKQLKRLQDLELCLVNNSSQDNTYQLLKDIKEKCESNVSIVDIKRNVSEISAIRAGTRFMHYKFNLRNIGYISTSVLKINRNSLNNLIKAICENQEALIEKNIEVLERQELKFILFQSLL